MNLYHYRIELVRVIDSDTCVFHVDLGFKVWLHDIRFRFARINAPELITDAGKLARAWLVEQLAASAGKLTCQSLGFDKYGRALGEVYADGRNINDAIVAAGHAKYVT